MMGFVPFYFYLLSFTTRRVGVWLSPDFSSPQCLRSRGAARTHTRRHTQYSAATTTSVTMAITFLRSGVCVCGGGV